MHARERETEAGAGEGEEESTPKGPGYATFPSPFLLVRIWGTLSSTEAGTQTELAMWDLATLN